MISLVVCVSIIAALAVRYSATSVRQRRLLSPSSVSRRKFACVMLAMTNSTSLYCLFVWHCHEFSLLLTAGGRW